MEKYFKIQKHYKYVSEVQIIIFKTSKLNIKTRVFTQTFYVLFLAFGNIW